MRFFAIGQQAEGFIAIGQEATGVFAFGQMATGVIAIGQLARGVIAIGQLSFGVFSIGMLSFGLIQSHGLGAGGRAGKGLILPLVPVPRKRAKLPERTTLDAIRRSGREGWLDVVIRMAGNGLPQLTYQGQPLDATLVRTLIGGAGMHAKLGGNALALVVPEAAGLRVTRLMAIPVAGLGGPVVAILQLIVLAVLCAAYWEMVLVDLGDFAVRVLRAILTGAVE